MTTATALRHEEFCLPRPGEDAARIEGYRQPKYDDKGLAVASVSVVRCLECGAASYDGVQRG